MGYHDARGSVDAQHVSAGSQLTAMLELTESHTASIQHVCVFSPSLYLNADRGDTPVEPLSHRLHGHIHFPVRLHSRSFSVVDILSAVGALTNVHLRLCRLLSVCHRTTSGEERSYLRHHEIPLGICRLGLALLLSWLSSRHPCSSGQSSSSQPLLGITYLGLVLRPLVGEPDALVHRNTRN